MPARRRSFGRSPSPAGRRMEAGFGESIPLACQDWAGTKAAYRFFSNDRVTEEDILRGHFDATHRRFATSKGPILVLHDTTEFSWRRKRPEAVGFTTTVNSDRDKAGRDRLHAVCGLLMHSSLAVTTDGLPLGMAAVKFWNRKKFKGTAALKRKVNPTRVPIEGKESMRWLDNLRRSTELPGEAARCVRIADREGDIWELYCLARELDTRFLVRRCVDRLAGDGSHKVSDAMAEVKVQGRHRVVVRDDMGKPGIAQVEIPYRRMTVRPLIGKQKRYPTLVLTLLHAREPEEPVGRPSIDWKPITDLPVDSLPNSRASASFSLSQLRMLTEQYEERVSTGGSSGSAIGTPSAGCFCSLVLHQASFLLMKYRKWGPSPDTPHTISRNGRASDPLKRIRTDRRATDRSPRSPRQSLPRPIRQPDSYMRLR